MNPLTGHVMGGRLVFGVAGGEYRARTPLWATFDANLNIGFEALVANNPQLPGSEHFGVQILTAVLHGNLYSSLDERVCIEVGTSLPLTHSALIEDNREKPDYSIGRFMIKPDLRIGTITEIKHTKCSGRALSS